MNSRQRKEYYRSGRPGEVYGIWNNITKRFVCGVRENTPQKAWESFRRKHRSKSAYCWRYEWKIIPEGWKNPPNELYVKEAPHDRTTD